ncbi:uncharacterized protein ARB_06713 [Trichophyton benhamiae CBS 112371]|uniref:Uncharacterized protein n=1 Tax=Arthroderma benhamiae (strain ATCC MYA-4681 / CBS 112371) TaxID=663331 RepID=D4ARH0_ARTBC|nr:uncharacterized protein ARB_06713 [Trichophyton benhamiae CBS 112371]EFE34313.1 hypothetical protein ARB_06713 [Trichophyton benhamiae CBS 112371]
MTPGTKGESWSESAGKESGHGRDARKCDGQKEKDKEIKKGREQALRERRRRRERRKKEEEKRPNGDRRDEAEEEKKS